MHFIKIMKTVLVDRATDFYTRSDRPEFWWFTLYAMIVAGLLMLIDNYIINYTFFSIVDPFGDMNESGVLVLLFFLGTLIQSLSLTARRLHDRGHSGWWQLLFFIPVLNFIPLYWCVRQAKDVPEALKYKNPYGKR
jgi:uncharacterized membrane protein YhaH (DUF805 family)